MINKCFSHKNFYCLFVFVTGLVFSQDLSFKVSKTKVNLAEPLTLVINIDQLHGEKVVDVPQNELLPFHFEEIKDSVSLSEENYFRRIDFAIYEEGKFTIPVLKIKVGTKVLKTTPTDILVVNPTKENEEINDYMPIEEVELGFVDYLQWYKFHILGFLVCIGIFYFIVKYFKRKKPSKEKLENISLVSKLHTLEQKEYIEKNNYRIFYIELIEISREILEKHCKIPAVELLTEDLIEFINKDLSIAEKHKSELKKVFSHGDMVKFAKIIPNQEIMHEDFSVIMNFAQELEKVK